MNEIYRITPPSGVVLNERKYPVITNNPTWSQICVLCVLLQLIASNSVVAPSTTLQLFDCCCTISCLYAVGTLRSEDISFLAKATLAGAPIGYWIGEIPAVIL